MAQSAAQATAPAVAETELILPSLFGDVSNPYGVRPFNFVYSLLAHFAVLALLLYVASVTVKIVKNPQATVTQLLEPGLTLPQAPTKSGGGGGGGSRELTPASKGTPPRSIDNPIAPPTVHPLVDPKLAANANVLVPTVPLPQSNTLGDLKGVLGPASNGSGVSGGIGTGSGGGVGSGNGIGVGPGKTAGIGDGVFHVGGGVSGPIPTYEPDPEYSEEARKARYQGTVTVSIIVGPDGHVRTAKVISPVGMGLDEKAVDTVLQWRFEPAKKDGHPVAVYASVEVNFHLY